MWDRVTVDSVAFARDARELRGAVAIADLPRLQDMLFDQAGQIVYNLTGAVNKDGMASLRLEIAAELLLTCQRCLGPVKFSLNSARSFVLVSQTETLGDPAEEPHEVERIHADAKLDVAMLVEDETILSLPMAAGHEPGACSPPVVVSDEGAGKLPFRALAVLKRP